MKLSRDLVGGLLVLIVVSCTVNGLPTTRKNSRRQMESTSAVVVPSEEVTPAAVVPTTDVPSTEAKVSETEVGSLAPIGDLVENSKPPTSTVHTFIEKEVEALTIPAAVTSTTAPKIVMSNGNVLPGLEATGPRPVYQGQGQGPEGGPPGPRPSNIPPPPPPSSTKKPEEEDDSSSEEDGEEEAVAGDEEATEDEEDEDEEEEEEEDEARVARKNNDQQNVAVESSKVSTKNKPKNQNQGKNQGHPMLNPNEPQPEALIPGYISETGEIFVPIDTLEKVMPHSYTIIPDTTGEKGRLGYSFYRSDIELADEPEEDEEDDDSAADATTSEEQEVEDDTSSASAEDEGESEEEAEPIRVSSFKVLYKQKAKPKEQEAEEESEEKEEKPDEVEGQGPSGPPSSGPGSGSGSGSTEEGEKTPALLTNQQPQFRPRPPLASIPATRPTNEDDENELRNRYLRRIPSYGMSNLMSQFPQYYGAYQDPRRPYFSYEPPQLNAGGYYY